MISQEDRDRIPKLPVWAKDLIKQLEHLNEPTIKECNRLRKEIERLKDSERRIKGSNEALMEILRDAGKGGNDWARIVVSILEGYEIFKNTKD